MRRNAPSTGMVISWLGFVLALAALPFLAGCGFGLGEGGDQPFPAPVPEVPEHPGHRPRVKGTVRFEARLREWLSEDRRSRPASARASMGALGWEADYLSSLRAVLEGEETRVTTSVGLDGGFEFPPQREGRRRLKLVGEDEPIAEIELLLEKRSRTDAVVEILGRDAGDLDGDGDRNEWVVSSHVHFRAPGIEMDRTFHPGGAVETRYPEGTVELGAPGAPTRVLSPGGRRELRGSEEAPRSTDRPLVLSSSVELLLEPDEKTAGLARLGLSVDREGGDRTARVTCRLISVSGETSELELLDDGSAADLDGSLRGHQGSGDDVAGDGRHTLLMPVDSSNSHLLYHGVAVLEARWVSGQTGALRAHYLHGPKQDRSTSRQTGLLRKLREARLLPDGPGLGATLAFSETPVPPVRGGFFGPDGQEAPMIPVSGPVRYESSALPAGVAGYYFVVIAGSEGVYHAGAVLKGGPAGVSLVGPEGPDDL